MGHKIIAGPRGIQVGIAVDATILSQVPQGQWSQIIVSDETIMAELEAVKNNLIAA